MVTNWVSGESAERKISAEKMLIKAKEIEKTKLSKGFIWMNLKNTSKLVAPKKIQEHLDLGYKIRQNE